VRAILLILAILLFSGCNSRKSFEPKNVSSASDAISKTGKKAVAILRDGVTFSDGTFLTRKGISSIKLPEGFHYVTQSSNKILASDNTGKILILNRQNGKVIKKGKLPFPLVSATIQGDKIYYVTQDDMFGVYDISTNKTIVSAKVGRAYAVDTRIANPISLGMILVVPTLDGKLLIIDPRNPKAARGMAIGKSYNLNNVIFLKKLGNIIIAATPKKIISASPTAMNKYEAPIADVAISNGLIYILTQDGRVIKLNPYLKVLAKKKFNYAQFVAIAVVNGKVYALDRSGALIVMDNSLKKSKVYNIGEVENYAFVAGSKLYKDDEVINLDKLNY